MKIVKVPEPSWWKFPPSKGINVRRETPTASNSVEGHNLNQDRLDIMLKSKLFNGSQPLDLLAPILNDIAKGDKSKFGNNRKKLWAYDAEGGIYQDISRLILQSRIEEAEVALSALPLKAAQWYYLKGIILWEKGRYAEAYNSIQQAAAMAPENREYMRALEYISQAYHPFTVSHFYKRLFEKICPWMYIILIFLFVVWLVSRII